MEKKITLTELRLLIRKQVNEELTFEAEQIKSMKDPKIQKLVDNINSMIMVAKDDDEPIVTSDGYYYNPIEYLGNGSLRITSINPWQKSRPMIDVILKRNMEYDGIPTLQDIKRKYVRVLKSAGILQNNTSNQPQAQAQAQPNWFAYNKSTNKIVDSWYYPVTYTRSEIYPIFLGDVSDAIENYGKENIILLSKGQLSKIQ